MNCARMIHSGLMIVLILPTQEANAESQPKSPKVELKNQVSDINKSHLKDLPRIKSAIDFIKIIRKANPEVRVGKEGKIDLHDLTSAMQLKKAMWPDERNLQAIGLPLKSKHPITNPSSEKTVSKTNEEKPDQGIQNKIPGEKRDALGQYGKEDIQNIYLSWALLGFGALIICFELYILNKRGNPWNEMNFKVVTTSLVIIMATFLVVAGFSNEQITPIVGLLAAIVGYILGKDAGISQGESVSSKGTSTEEVKHSEMSSNQPDTTQVPTAAEVGGDEMPEEGNALGEDS